MYADAYQWNIVQKRAQLCWVMTDNTDVSINVTKPEETTTKVIEKHKDSIKPVIQDTMKTIHENIDKVQSNVERVQTDVRSLEQGWRKELNSALDKVKLKIAI